MKKAKKKVKKVKKAEMKKIKGGVDLKEAANAMKRSAFVEAYTKLK